MPNEISTTRRSLAPTTYAEAFEFAQHLAKSSMVPTEYRGKPENILLAIQWGMEVGLAPLQAIQNIAVINGKPSVYGDALLAMVKGSPVCDDVIERFEGSGDDLTAVCEAKREGKAPVVSRFGIKDAKAAHLWGKTGPWTQYPRRMLQMRARGFALRDAFPDVLRGVITREEAEDYPVDVSKPREMVEVTPQRDLDAFAKGSEVVDVETGEITEIAPVEELARAAAAKGREEFRSFLQSLSREEFDAIRALVGTREEPGELTLQATGVDEQRERDPFGLPPARGAAAVAEPASPDTPVERSPARQSDVGDDMRSSPSPQAGERGNFAERFAALAPQPTDLAGDELDWPGYEKDAMPLIAEASPTEAAAYRVSENKHMQKMKLQAGDGWRRIVNALSDRAKAAA